MSWSEREANGELQQCYILLQMVGKKAATGLAHPRLATVSLKTLCFRFISFPLNGLPSWWQQKAPSSGENTTGPWSFHNALLAQKALRFVCAQPSQVEFLKTGTQVQCLQRSKVWLKPLRHWNCWQQHPTTMSDLNPPFTQLFDIQAPAVAATSASQ